MSTHIYVPLSAVSCNAAIMWLTGKCGEFEMMLETCVYLMHKVLSIVIHAVMRPFTWKPQGRLSFSSCIFLQDIFTYSYMVWAIWPSFSGQFRLSSSSLWEFMITHCVGFVNKEVFVVISSGFNNKFWVVHQPKMPHLPMAQAPPASSVHISSPAKSVSMTIVKETVMTFFTTFMSHLWGPMKAFL